MKHNFLRRMGALLLAFALALPMAVTTVWAADGDNFQVSINVPQNVSLSDLRSSVQLSAGVTGVVSGGTVTYRWTWEPEDSGNISITPVNSANVTIRPVELGTGKLKVTATCTWTDNSSRPSTKTATAEARRDVRISSVPLDALNPKEPPKTMKTGETQTLEVVYTPENATDKSVNWSVYPTGIVEVTGYGGTAVVRALKEGEARITARGSGVNTAAYFPIAVTDARTPEVKITPAQEDIPTTLSIGEQYKLTADVTAAPPAAKVEWKSSSPSVASVTQDGWIDCLRAGTVTITCTATGTNNKVVSDSRRITIIDPKNKVATSLSVRGSDKVSLSQGEDYQLAVNVSPATAQVTWSSDNYGVAYVDPSTGKVTGIAPGKANVTATAQKADGTPLTAKFEITVMGRATGIEFRDGVEILGPDSDGRLYTQFNYSGGRTKTVYANVRSDGNQQTNTYITFTSSNTNLVTATAHGTSGVELTIPSTRPAGRATITATVYDNTTKQPVKDDNGEPLKAELDVVVSGLALSASTLTMYEGESRTLNITGTYGEADSASTNVDWRSSDSSIVSAEGSIVGASLNAWTKGTATITVTKGNYSASCTVKVVEDAGTIVNAGSAAAGNSIKLGTSSVINRLNTIAKERTGSNMEYISSIFISPDEGVVYNTYTSEADTGSGVSMAERYYVNRTTPVTEYIGALSFVPNKTYSGEARISYIGRANGQDVSGIISVNVTGIGENGSDVTYTATAAPVTFVADDFNIICNNKQGRSLNYVTFTPPDASQGALYENYTNATHPGQKVVSTTRYNRNGSPNVGRVTFVPAEGYSGRVRIAYRAVDSSGAGYSGYVTVIVNAADGTSDPADIHYSVPQNGWVSFRPQDFASASLRAIGEPLSHVRFSLPSSNSGTLLYNYRGFGDYDSAVSSTTSYYQSGSPALSAVSYVPATTSSGQAAFSYTGYGTRGGAFTGTVYVAESSSSGQPGASVHYDYSVKTGASVALNAADFNTACRSATGADLDYISFSALPAAGEGTLRYRTVAGTSYRYSAASTSDKFYRVGANSSTPLISNLSFLAGPAYTGIVRVPYTGWNTNGVPFTAEFTIQVLPNIITYNGTAANPIRLQSADITDAVCDTLTRDLSYIEFTSLPDPSSGRLYLNYSGYGTGSEARTGTRYYASRSPGIGQLSFLARGRFTGDAVASYTAYSTSGEQMSGQITFHIASTSSSGYFSDMAGYSWAVPSVDYLYQNSVTDGMTKTTFGPSLNIRRSDFLLMLHRIFHFSGGSTSNTGFADVPSTAYYAQAVSAAKRMGVVSGDGVNFMPSSPVTRQDAMVMVYNAMRASGKLQGNVSTSVLNSFPDRGSVSSYARNAVSTLVDMGAVNGSNGMLNPRAYITRAEAAVILHFVMTA